MIDTLKVKGKIVTAIASGDLTIPVQLNSEYDNLGNSLRFMKKSLNAILKNVHLAVNQVSVGADQISQSSQSLSQGATEQASSLEQISSSLLEINSQAKKNAENSLEANTLAKTNMEKAHTGNNQMKNLLTMMEQINTSSDEIKKVVELIDDIAFQINLLALNANVEAARAGKFGKGFAVVADEVRSLAIKSANAVKETTQMVEESLANIREGYKAAETTSVQFDAIVKGSSTIARYLDDISSASKEQAIGIDQINNGLDQISQVTQANTANAEESASASEELASQAQILKKMIAKFKLENTITQKQQTVANLPEGFLQKLVADEMHKIALRKNRNKESQAGNKNNWTYINPKDAIKLDDDDFDKF